MTYQEAKELFQEDLARGKCSDDCPECNAIELAIEALEKQIPKKTVKAHKRPTEWGCPYKCPECEAEQPLVKFMSYDGSEPKEKHSYCWKCGRKLDWSDTK